MESPLSLAVRHLYGTGAISSDKEIAEKTGYNKTTVSSYLNGKIKPSPAFIDAFETKFGLNLKDFAKGGRLEPIKVSNPLQILSEKVIDIVATSRVNQSLLIEVLSNQTGKTVMELQRVVNTAKDAELKGLMDELKHEPA